MPASQETRHYEDVANSFIYPLPVLHSFRVCRLIRWRVQLFQKLYFTRGFCSKCSLNVNRGICALFGIYSFIDRNKTALRGYHRRQSVGLFPLLIPGPQKILYFFFGCRADGRSALIDRFAAVWATVRQQLCFNAVFCWKLVVIVIKCVYVIVVLCLSLSKGF